MRLRRPGWFSHRRLDPITIQPHWIQHSQRGRERVVVALPTSSSSSLSLSKLGFMGLEKDSCLENKPIYRQNKVNYEHVIIYHHLGIRATSQKLNPIMITHKQISVLLPLNNHDHVRWYTHISVLPNSIPVGPQAYCYTVCCVNIISLVLHVWHCTDW